jgi:hypothetical protein
MQSNLNFYRTCVDFILNMKLGNLAYNYEVEARMAHSEPVTENKPNFIRGFY